ncbi:MAG: hypothetical protein GY936_03140 [Ignavibacteriae bacterium]|nr:hypothetical protein [Ignavibacteriota bacterium]
MNKIIIAVHGLGNKPPKETLEKWWLESMCEGLNNIGKFQFSPKFELVYWADILNDKPLSEKISDPKSLYFLDEKYVPESEVVEPRDDSMRERILNFLETQMDRIFLNDDLTSNFDIISETIFEKYFMELDVYYTKKENQEEEEIIPQKNIIRNRLSEVLKKHKGKEILLLAHSMGSIIALDVCNLLVPNINIDTFVTMGSPLGLPIIVSKIADELKEENPKLLRLTTPENISKNWINYYDLEDSVAINYHLGIDYAENRNGVKVKGVNVFNNYEINGNENPHKSYGYLRTPEFSNLLSEFLTKDISTFDLWQLKTKEKLIKFFKKIRGN